LRLPVWPGDSDRVLKRTITACTVWCHRNDRWPAFV